MSTTVVIWVSVAVAVALLIALAVGLLLVRRRRISLAEREEEESAEATDTAKPPPRYQAGGPISFSSGGGGPPSAPPRPEPPAPPPSEAPRAPEAPPVPPEAPRAPEAPPAPPPKAPPEPAPEAPEAPAAPAEEAPPAPPPKAPPEPAPEAPPVPREAPRAPEAPPAPPPKAPPEPAPAPPPEPAPAPPPEPAPAPPPEPAEEIAPTSGRLEQLRGRLSRSRSALGQSLLGLLGAGDLDEDSWTDVEDTLVLADLGATATMEIVEQLRSELASRGVRTADQARAALRDVLVEALRPELDRSVRALPHTGDGTPTPGVVLVAGVNGTGKTTTTGKLARVLVADGRRVLLGAADTFRAAAVDQLETWGHRAGAEVVRGPEGADPASVAFDAVKRGTTTHVDTVLLDTAGRLHTKTGLMDELGKVKRVVSKQADVDEVLLVLDATTGQNGLAQARVFAEVVDITGVVLTKLDGTAKGGIVFQVQRELGVPVKLVGLGEGVDDLAPFEPYAFVDALLG